MRFETVLATRHRSDPVWHARGYKAIQRMGRDLSPKRCCEHFRVPTTSTAQLPTDRASLSAQVCSSVDPAPEELDAALRAWFASPWLTTTASLAIDGKAHEAAPSMTRATKSHVLGICRP